MNDIIENIEDIDNTQATPHSALALLWTDTSYRLAGLLLKQTNNARAKENPPKPPLVVGMNDIRQAFSLIGGFDTYFVEASLDDDGAPVWVSGNKFNLMPVYYQQLSKTTTNLLEHAEALKGVNMQVAAKLIIDERDGKGIPVPDGSGPSMEDFPMEVANKAVFYASNLIRILRSNGGSLEFSPRSSMNLSDITRAAEAQLHPTQESEEQNRTIDHREEESWDVTGKLQRATDVFYLEPVELEKAVTYQNALIAWLALADQDSLRDELEYQAAQAADFLKQRAASNPIRGVERKPPQAA